MWKRRVITPVHGLLLFLCVWVLCAHETSAITVVSVLRATPATSPLTAGRYANADGTSKLTASTTNTRITLRLSETDGLRDPRLFHQNIVNFTAELVDASNRVVPMSCGVEFEGSHLTYSVQLIDWIPVVQNTMSVPLLQARATAAESWSASLVSNTAGFISDNADLSSSSSSEVNAARRRLLVTTAPSCSKPGVDPVLCYDPQDPLVLGKSLSSDQFNNLVNGVNERYNNLDFILNGTDNPNSATAAQAAQLAGMQQLLDAFKNASRALSDHHDRSENFQKTVSADYDKWLARYNQTANDLNATLDKANIMVKNGAERTKSMFADTQLLLLDAQASLDAMSGDAPRTAFYNSYVLNMATIVQSLIQHVDTIQMENDNDYLAEQALSILMQDMYGNVRVRRTLASLFQVPAAAPGATDLPMSTMQMIAAAQSLNTFLPADLPSPDTTKITPYYFEAVFTWNTYLDYATETSTVAGGDKNYFDVDVGATLAVINPAAAAGTGNPGDKIETARRLIKNTDSSQTRLYANYRRYNVYCTEAHIVSLANSWTSFLQLQQMLGPPGCSVALGTCRCWAYVRRQRCALSKDAADVGNSVFSPSFYAAAEHQPMSVGLDGKTTRRMPMSLRDMGVTCPNNDDVPLPASVTNWFDPSDDNAATGQCTPSAGITSLFSASGKPSCELVTDITVFNAELQQVCSNTVRAGATPTTTTSTMAMAAWFNTQTIKTPIFLNSTQGRCDTHYQMMAVQANTGGETIPFSLYTQQQAALGWYVKLAARAYEMRVYGYVPKHGTSTEQPYYVQGPMRAADTAPYLRDIQNGHMSADWVEPVRVMQTQTMTYGAISSEMIPRYRFTRQQRQQRISLSCNMPGTDEWFAQTAQDVTIQVAADAVEPTTFTWVGWLDDMYLPSDHAFVSFRDSSGTLVNKTRYTFAVPDEAMSSGGPMETREHKIDYVRCGLTCLNKRAAAIDPSYTAADLEQQYNGDIISLIIDDYLRGQEPPLPGLTFNTPVNQQRFTTLTTEEFLAAESRDDFVATAMSDSAHQYFHPLRMADGTGFLALQELQAEADPSYTPVYNMAGPVPLECDMAWFESHNLPPTKQCLFLETHRPIATLDPVYHVFQSWDKQSTMNFADTAFTTTFSFVVAGNSFVGQADAVVTCPPPHMIQLLTAASAAPQLRIYNDKLYNVSMHVLATPSSSTSADQASCTVFDRTQTIAPQQAVIVTLPFATTCDGLSIVVEGMASDIGATPTPPVVSRCWTWSGNLTAEIALAASAALQTSRVAAGQVALSDISSSALLSGLDLTTQVLSLQVGANEMARVNALFNSMKTYSSSTAQTMLRVLSSTSNIDGVPTGSDVEAFRELIQQARLGSSNLRALILAASAYSVAGYSTVLNASIAADAARAVFAKTSAEVMANLTSTADFLHKQLYTSRSLIERSNKTITQFNRDINTLASQLQVLQSIINVYGAMPPTINDKTFVVEGYTTYPNIWRAFADNLYGDLQKIPGAALAVVKTVIKAAADLAKDLACSAVPIFCNGAIMTLLIIIGCIIAFICICGPSIKFLCGGRR